MTESITPNADAIKILLRLLCGSLMLFFLWNPASEGIRFRFSLVGAKCFTGAGYWREADLGRFSWTVPTRLCCQFDVC